MKNLSCFRRYGIFAIVATQALFLAACKEGAAPLVPSAIQVVAGSQQTVTVAATVPVAPSVKVVASNGQPVKGVTVTFAPAAESGTVTGGTQITDALGVATVTSWKLGTKSGVSTLNVSVQGVSPIAITVTTAAGAVAAIKVVSGDNQTATVGSQLAAAPQIRAVDAYDNGVAATAVSFALVNGGTIERTNAQTDANGVAAPGNWTLATKSGIQVLTVTAGSISLSMTATANADVASQIGILTQPSTSNGSGAKLSVQPVVEFRDRFNNAATITGIRNITATLASGTGTLTGTTTMATATGRVAFNDLVYTGSGDTQLRFTSNGFADALSSSFTVTPIAQCAGPVVSLNYTLGQINRYVTTQSDLPGCLDFSTTRNAGQQYIVMFENLSPSGDYGGAVFPGLSSDDASMSVALRTGAAPAANTVAAAAIREELLPEGAINGWNMGGTRLYEAEPKAAGKPALVQRNGEWISANSANAAIAVGDTLSVQLEGISRLGGDAALTKVRKAIVKYVDANIVIAEDARIVSADLTFARTGGALNSPLTADDMLQIATEYATYAKVEADKFFNSQYNSATTADPGRPIAVHTLMFDNNTWGYTYSTVNYFAFDFWAGTTDGKTRGFSQIPQRTADHLFMHEIAHMRHWGLLERAGRQGARGNRWLVEGFARATERFPFAMRVLNNANFSRTQNIVLPVSQAGYPSFSADEIPPYWYASASMYGGYSSSSFVFDYFSDQVAGTGADWWKALQELLVAAGTSQDIDGVVNKYLGYGFGMLFTRARVALYTDDIGTAGLPAWTQYLMVQLRPSRTVSASSSLGTQDPRVLWPKIIPGVTTMNESRQVAAGGAFGYVIDGSTATGDVRLNIDPTKAVNGVMSIVRIK